MSPAAKSEPIQEFFSIGEVCELTGLKPHVLRYWESQFRFLSPAKNRSGNRVYQRREVELIMLVKHLLYDEKYTIEGARQKVDDHRKQGDLKVVARGALTMQALQTLEAISRTFSRRSVRLPSPTEMRLLVTNDDGILAHGIECLCAAAEPLGDVTVVAPDREQSATSHSLTLHHPLRPVRRGERKWQVDGTPTDCVMLAIEALMPERPDFVLSGINHGQNMGEDVLYSGTVAAAMEGLSLGVPSIAVSFAGGDLRADVSQLREQVKVLTPLLKHLVSLPNFPADTLFNVNLPPVSADDVKGVKLTRLGRRAYSGSVAPMKDPWGRAIYWIGGGEISWRGEPDSDFRAVQEGYVSVTPLHLDLTHYDALKGAEQWWRSL
jgi:5'-nucleotidase